MNARMIAASALIATGTALFALQGLALAHGDEGEKHKKDRVPEAVSVGEPVNCITTNRIRTTRVHDDKTIDFEMAGGKIYRNTLPNKCSGLGFEEAFSYKTSIGQLCSVDIITVLRTGAGGFAGPSCGLGEFQEVKLVDKDKQSAD
ncbi:MAG: hypothetical protein R3E02_13650 [Blastomonas sp.]